MMQGRMMLYVRLLDVWKGALHHLCRSESTSRWHFGGECRDFAVESGMLSRSSMGMVCMLQLKFHMPNAVIKERVSGLNTVSVVSLERSRVNEQ